jgi:hypothetical protein
MIRDLGGGILGDSIFVLRLILVGGNGYWRGIAGRGNVGRKRLRSKLEEGQKSRRGCQARIFVGLGRSDELFVNSHRTEFSNMAVAMTLFVSVIACMLIFLLVVPAVVIFTPAVVAPPTSFPTII